MTPVMIDSHNFGRYTALAAAKSVAGIGVPGLIMAHNRAQAVFLCVKHGHIRIMVGRVGASSEAPGSMMTGNANPARLTTIRKYKFFKLFLNPLGPSGYICLVVANSTTRLRILKINPRQTRLLRVFLSVYICSMVAQAGASSEAPVSSWVAGNANPVWATTNHGFASVGGSYQTHTQEAATMATTLTLATPEITIVNGKAVTTSLAIADCFSKRHERVLDKIRNLECSPEFAEHNFVSSEYIDATGRKLPCYQITRDGFAFLAMGFAGKRAAQFKEAYITAFNQMEKALIGKVDTSCVAHNAHAVYLYMVEIHRVWLEQLYPMLVSAQSPLASSLYDYINDGVFVAGLVDSELNEKHKEVRK